MSAQACMDDYMVMSVENKHSDCRGGEEDIEKWRCDNHNAEKYLRLVGAAYQGETW
jgi:hypothetical protein